ncbi:MAG: TrmH family RNA methyltransferase [Flavobacteriales bacterium]
MNRKLNTDELNRLDKAAFADAPKNDMVLVLDNVRSALNVGSIFRSADAFRVQQIVCCGFTPAPPHRDILKTALGATETVVWSCAEDVCIALQTLKNKGYQCVAIEQTSESIALHQYMPELQKPIALVLGNEVEGVQQRAIDLCESSLEIAQHGTKHSLNVAVCAGIVLHHLYFKKNGL